MSDAASKLDLVARLQRERDEATRQADLWRAEAYEYAHKAVRRRTEVEQLRALVTLAEAKADVGRLLAEAQVELHAAREEIDALRAEVRKQVFGSRVVFDREVVERAQLASSDPAEWPEGKRPTLPSEG